MMYLDHSESFITWAERLADLSIKAGLPLSSYFDKGLRSIIKEIIRRDIEKLIEKHMIVPPDLLKGRKTILGFYNRATNTLTSKPRFKVCPHCGKPLSTINTIWVSDEA